MRILILGASGRTGRLAVQEALRRGHEVHALVRNLTAFPPQKGLKCFMGSPLVQKDVLAAMGSCQAVLVALNVSRKSDNPWAKVVSPPDLVSQSMRQVIAAMRSLGLTRLLTLSAWGVGDSWEQLPLPFRLVIRLSRIGVTYQDHARQEALLRASGLEWTLLRPVFLDDVDRFRIPTQSTPDSKPGGTRISRMGVASFMLDALEQGRYVQQAPVIWQE